MSGIPYEMPPAAGLEIANGVLSQCFELDFPSRSLITKLLIVQSEGVGENFTAALYNRLRACEGDLMSESVGDEVGLIPPDAYRVTPDLAGTAGKLLYFSEQSTGGAGFPFFNQDQDLVACRLGNARKIYLKITSAGTGDKKFAVAIAGFLFK